ncbi:MAG: hypothetical protein HYZ16_04155 [Bacteroidetes bacterium]|nr:hypothetical protein [Bacteroidota bacterium]
MRRIVNPGSMQLRLGPGGGEHLAVVNTTKIFTKPPEGHARFKVVGLL